MQVAEKITAVEFVGLLEAGQEKLTNLYSYFKAGAFLPAEILAAYKMKDQPRFFEKVQAFSDGKLFLAQTQDFDSFLDGVGSRDDKYRAWEYLSIEESVQQINPEIRLFIQARIHCARPGAKELEGMAATEKLREIWIGQNKRNGWNWRA